MDQLHTLLTLFVHFMVLSLFAVGGGPSMLLPQMRQEFVLQFHFLTDRSFTELLAVAQATPGPNFLFVPLIGFRAASWLGAIVSIVAFLALPMVIALFVGRLLHQHDNEWVARSGAGSGRQPADYGSSAAPSSRRRPTTRSVPWPSRSGSPSWPSSSTSVPCGGVSSPASPADSHLRRLV